MTKGERNWTLIVLKQGRPVSSVALVAGVNTVGRDPANTIPLAHPSVSRFHAEIVCADSRLQVRDLDSRNGVRINGVPRKQAVLQPGDLLEVGAVLFQFQLAAGFTEAPAGNLVLSDAQLANAQDQTDVHELGLPQITEKRQLSTLYHVCFWVAEDLEESVFTEKCLRVLVEGLQAQEAQFYDAERNLLRWVNLEEGKPALRLAQYLAAKFQDTPEAFCFHGRDLRGHQQNVADYNYLVAPLRAPDSLPGPMPFVVLLRPGAWEDFSSQDRVLLQAVSQLWVRTSERVHRVEALRTENASLRRQRPGPLLLGSSPALEHLRREALRAARTKVTISLQGETGSGKEVIAHFIHANSPCQDGPFVKVNCAAVPPGLIESELFGHMPGAFTGARADHCGKFEQAHGGTLFLDEVGEMPAGVQAKVLRAIETGEIEKLGSERPVHVDVRVIAASHRNLNRMVQDREFRQDLYYRLSVLTLRVPPLREHAEDIELLARHFLDQFCRENGFAEFEFEAEALAALRQHPWPGNVRELRNVVQRCAVAAEQTLLSAALVREKLQHPAE